MKNKKLLFILLGVLVICIIGVSLFCVIRGIMASNKWQEYCDVYRERAEEYIKSDAEILSKYGSNISVEFDDSVSYIESNRGFFDRYIEVFAPKIPASVEEFAEGIELLSFDVEINNDDYEITFEKNGEGELVVSDLSEVKQ